MKIISEAVRPSGRLFLSEPEMSARAGRVPSLDGLRAVSVLIVLCSHFISAKLFPGSFGVYVFFVISGFLITRLLLAEQAARGHISLPRFYGRRALRLYPVVIVYAAAVVAVYLVGRLRIDWIQPISVLFYFANYHYAPMLQDQFYHTMPFLPLWSLSIEEHFYFLLPAVVLLLRRRPAALLVAMIGVCLACLFYRLAVATVHPDLIATHFFYYRTECRIDSLAFGVALSAMCEMAQTRRWLARLASPVTLALSMTAILVSMLYRDPFFRETLRYSVQGLAIALAVVSILFRGGVAPYILNTVPFNFVGRISYSLYVWSICTVIIVKWATGLQGTLAILVYFLTAFAAACGSYFLVEKPLLRLRHRLGSAADTRDLSDSAATAPALAGAIGGGDQVFDGTHLTPLDGDGPHGL